MGANQHTATTNGIECFGKKGVIFGTYTLTCTLTKIELVREGARQMKTGEATFALLKNPPRTRTLTNSLHRKRSFRFPRAQRRNHFSPSLPPPPPPFFGIVFATTPFIESPAGKQGQPPPTLPTSSMFSFGILFATGVEGRVPFQVKIGSGTVISLREETGVATLLEMSSNPILEVTLLFNATTNRTRTGCGTRFYVCTGDACVFHISVPLVPLYPSILHQLCQTDQGCYYYFFWRPLSLNHCGNN